MPHSSSSHATSAWLQSGQQKGPRENLAGLKTQLLWKLGRTLIAGVLEFDSAEAGLHFKNPDFNSIGSTLIEALTAQRYSSFVSALMILKFSTW